MSPSLMLDKPKFCSKIKKQICNLKTFSI